MSLRANCDHRTAEVYHCAISLLLCRQDAGRFRLNASQKKGTLFPPKENLNMSLETRSDPRRIIKKNWQLPRNKSFASHWHVASDFLHNMCHTTGLSSDVSVYSSMHQYTRTLGCCFASFVDNLVQQPSDSGADCDRAVRQRLK